ncbi:hypothetical protein IQ07DRAFT_35307 [Pyrenochaeta sp. DS3sAY3a]|nr:hypothetical protein IQ07DRAFT_35307 [Pyrenochaeta sp. DS3sAY3a]
MFFGTPNETIMCHLGFFQPRFQSNPLLTLTSGGNRRVVCTRERLQLRTFDLNLGKARTSAVCSKKTHWLANMTLLSFPGVGILYQLPMNRRVCRQVETMRVSCATTAPHAPQLRFLALDSPTRSSQRFLPSMMLVGLMSYCLGLKTCKQYCLSIPMIGPYKAQSLHSALSPQT